MKKLIFLLLPLFVLAFSKSNILALSWMNTYCQNSNKIECKTRSEFSHNNFTIHGLWPKKMKCSNERVNLSNSFLKKLAIYMPSKYLIKHEWRKHGTCFGASPKQYFSIAMKLTKEFDESVVNNFFARNKGKKVTLEQVRYLFAKSFGNKNIRKFQMICKRGYISEIRLKLYGDARNDNLQTLLNRAYNLRKKQCREGIISY